MADTGRQVQDRAAQVIRVDEITVKLQPGQAVRYHTGEDSVGDVTHAGVKWRRKEFFLI
jgi:hypothetical protein